jgi:hypothetical protein
MEKFYLPDGEEVCISRSGEDMYICMYLNIKIYRYIYIFIYPFFIKIYSQFKWIYVTYFILTYIVFSDCLNELIDDGTGVLPPGSGSVGDSHSRGGIVNQVRFMYIYIHLYIYIYCICTCFVVLSEAAQFL